MSRLKLFNVIACLSLALLAAGCVGRSKSEERARQAFIEGQRAGATLNAQQSQTPQAKFVTVLGEVRNPTIPWTEGLTLAQAIAQAWHTGVRSPRAIVLRHGDESATFNPNFVVQNGNEIPVEPGDVIELVR
jgi:hypothetical protein